MKDNESTEFIHSIDMNFKGKFKEQVRVEYMDDEADEPAAIYYRDKLLKY